MEVIRRQVSLSEDGHLIYGRLVKPSPSFGEESTWVESDMSVDPHTEKRNREGVKVERSFVIIVAGALGKSTQEIYEELGRGEVLFFNPAKK